jgi:uncharacterized protein (DUF302 family)
MLEVVASSKTVPEIGRAFPEACARHQLGVLGVINIRRKLKEKGVPFDRDCLIFEVCNPQQAKTVLEDNIAIATALPCRIAVYREEGRTRIATIKPTALLGLFPNPELLPVAREMEEILLRLMQDLA